MNILELKFDSMDLGQEVTIRQYFYELMKSLWEEKEVFSGKRPFGNSGWEYELMACLISNKLIVGELDEDGYVSECDKGKFDSFVMENIINPLFNENNLNK